MTPLSNLIDSRELLDFSQHFGVARSYMGSRLFPDRKTQYIEQEYDRLAENGNLPLSAMVHAFDTEAHIGSRVPLEKVRVEELLIKEKINLTEQVRRLTHGLGMDSDALRDYVFDDVARMAERVVTRAERAKMDALSKGKFTISENHLAFEVDYGIPEDHFVTSDWADFIKADILSDVREWRRLAVSKGYSPNVAITSDTVLYHIMRNSGIQTAIFGTTATGILPTLDQVNALFASQFGLTIQTNDERYGLLGTDGGKVAVSSERFFPENEFVMVTTGADGAVGAGLWGVTPEEDEQGGAFDTLRQQQFVTVATWDTPDPVTTWTKASGLMVPVLPNPYGHVIATVIAADDSEG